MTAIPVFSDGQDVKVDTIKLGEVVVSSLRIDRKIKELPASLSVVRAIDYQRQSAFTLSNVLNNEPGISMGGDGIWSTNVNIRGLGEDRMVILIDGNRIETATDLTASLSMIDVNNIERVEVIKGAQSSLYGSGAIGGIVNIITNEGKFSNRPYLSGKIVSGYSSVNQSVSNHAAVSSGSKRWFLDLSGTNINAGNIKTPDGILPNSGFKTNSVMAKIGIKPFANHLFKVQFQRNASYDVGIPGGSAFPGPAEAKYSDIERRLLSASYEITNISNLLSSIKLSYFNQYINREVMLNPNTVTQTTLINGNIQRTTPELFTPIGKHLTNGVQLQTIWKPHINNTLVAGIDVWGRKLTTQRTKFIRVDIINPSNQIVKTNNIVRGETPIPQSSFTNAGIYLQDESKLMEGRLILNIGGRIDGVYIENKAGYDVDYIITNGVRNDAPSTQRRTFEEGNEQNISWSANAGILYKLSKTTDFSFNLARSFRSPSLEERFKYIDLGNFVRLGDPALKPERGFSADMGLRIWKEKFTMQSGLFFNYISDMVVEIPGEFTYILTTDSQPVTIPAFINSNISRALLYGFDFKAEYNFAGNWVALISGSYVRGKNIKAHENLPLIPPAVIRGAIRYSMLNIGSAEVSLKAAAKQWLVAPGEQETNGYYRVDLLFNSQKINLKIAHLQLFFGIDNLTNKRYSNHLSTNRGDINVEPGRNLFVRATISF